MYYIYCIVQCNENESVFTDQFSRDPIPGHVSAGGGQWCAVSSGQGGALCWVVVCPPAVLTTQPHCYCLLSPCCFVRTLTLDTAAAAAATGGGGGQGMLYVK